MNTFCKKKNHAKQPKHLQFAGTFFIGGIDETEI